MKKDILKDLPPSSQVNIRLWLDGDGLVNIAFETIQPNMKVVIDASAMESFNNTLTEKVVGMNPKDPKVIGYLKEYSERWLDSCWRSGYVLLEDVMAKDIEGESLYKPWKFQEKKQ